jgi:hypothetical protein
MKSSLRLAVLACASVIGLAFAVPALAAYNPSLTMEQSSYKTGTAITADTFIFVPQNDDPTAKLTIFSPAGYNANLTAAPGTKIGRVAALVKLLDLGGGLFPLAGDVVVANPADPAIQAAAARCTPGVTNQAMWVLSASLQGQAISIPVFVNKVGPLVTQQVCLAPPDVPAGTPGRATLGAKLVSADFTVRGVFTNAAAKGGYEWAGIFTPYTPGTGAPNAGGTNEWRTFVGLPSSLTLAKAKAKKGLKLVGKLTVQGLSPARIRLANYSGRKAQPAPNAVSGGTGKRIGRTARLPASGKYSITRPSVKFTTFFQTRLENYGTTCTGPSPSGLPVPCKGEDLAALTSNQVKATKPRKKR